MGHYFFSGFALEVIIRLEKNEGFKTAEDYVRLISSFSPQARGQSIFDEQAARLSKKNSHLSIRLPAPYVDEIEQTLLSGICQDTSKKLVRSLFIPEEPQQGLCPYASLPQDIFLTGIGGSLSCVSCTMPVRYREGSR